MDVVRGFPGPVAIGASVAEAWRQILMSERIEGKCRFGATVIGVAAGTGFPVKRLVKRCFSRICRNQVPVNASDADIVRFVA